MESRKWQYRAPKTGGNDTNLPESNLLSKLRDKKIVSITEQTAIEVDSIAIMLDGNPAKEMIASVSFPKDVKVDDTMFQQIVKDSIKNVS
ncbi:hypothetical protein ACIQYL_10165 [Lysinibacillus xylanilyticus]|uniref:hypothetical protein n=1 Tax=Lysinibacillus xylanilyticus TaxID=582475 RepID=UPI00380BDF64